ncbi:MAG: hypothetical protein H8E16_11030 [Flavobacteriales bacterium]|nr:hypothetical protein [Flavobacteriales bacterium]
MIILSIILAIVITSAFFVVRNLIKQTERLEDFIIKQSEAIVACGVRLKQLDQKGTFHADDEIGFFFKSVEEIQEALNEFTLK